MTDAWLRLNLHKTFTKGNNKIKNISGPIFLYPIQLSRHGILMMQTSQDDINTVSVNIWCEWMH